MLGVGLFLNHIYALTKEDFSPKVISLAQNLFCMEESNIQTSQAHAFKILRENVLKHMKKIRETSLINTIIFYYI